MTRRNNLNENHPSELAIRHAITEVENIGADPVLTSVVIDLDNARNKLATYLDEKIANGQLIISFQKIEKI